MEGLYTLQSTIYWGLYQPVTMSPTKSTNTCTRFSVDPLTFGSCKNPCKNPCKYYLLLPGQSPGHNADKLSWAGWSRKQGCRWTRERSSSLVSRGKKCELRFLTNPHLATSSTLYTCTLLFISSCGWNEIMGGPYGLSWFEFMGQRFEGVGGGV